MKAWIRSRFRDRYKVRRYPSTHCTYFKTRDGAVNFCAKGYRLEGGEWQMYKLNRFGHTTKVPWF